MHVGYLTGMQMMEAKEWRLPAERRHTYSVAGVAKHGNLGSEALARYSAGIGSHGDHWHVNVHTL